MKNSTLRRDVYFPGLLIAMFGLLLVSTSCHKGKYEDLNSAPADVLSTDDHGSGDDLKGFLQVNLVANNGSYGAAHTDTTLINGWGIAFSATGTPWVSSQEGHVSDVYNREGVFALGPVRIPSPGSLDGGGNPTGAVFSGSTTDFIIPAGNGTANAAARFIFCGVDGVISAWNGTWGVHAYRKFNNAGTSVYTGLTTAVNNGATYLYAADFKRRRIAVWDHNWAPVSMPFIDFRIPWGYAPFNIQGIGEYLYVTYAKVGDDGDEEKGIGKGFVDVFRPNGSLVRRFASHGLLNAPWGVAMAPATFFPDRDEHGHGHDYDRDHHDPQPAILVGNFGDGHINVYSVSGDFRGQLGRITNHGSHPLIIDGLWALMFPPSTSTIDPNRLYFAAGPKDETNGLFGYIIKDSTVGVSHAGPGHGSDY